MSQAIVSATLYLEVRSRGRPGKPNLEQRIYTSGIEIDPNQPDEGIVTLLRHVETWGGSVYQSSTRFYPESYDPETRVGIYRESYRRSDRLVDDLELYGWTRRRDLEEGAQEEGK